MKRKSVLKLFNSFYNSPVCIINSHSELHNSVQTLSYIQIPSFVVLLSNLIFFHARAQMCRGEFKVPLSSGLKGEEFLLITFISELKAAAALL